MQRNGSKFVKVSFTILVNFLQNENYIKIKRSSLKQNKANNPTAVVRSQATNARLTAAQRPVLPVGAEPARGAAVPEPPEGRHSHPAGRAQLAETCIMKILSVSDDSQLTCSKQRRIFGKYVTCAQISSLFTKLILCKSSVFVTAHQEIEMCLHFCKDGWLFFFIW